MLAFETQVNGEKKILAGAQDVSFLLLEVNGMGRLGAKSNLPLQPNCPPFGVLFSITGFNDNDETKKWVSFRSLNVGDRVKVRLVQVASADQPESGEAVTK